MIMNNQGQVRKERQFRIKLGELEFHFDLQDRNERLFNVLMPIFLIVNSMSNIILYTTKNSQGQTYVITSHSFPLLVFLRKQVFSSISRLSRQLSGEKMTKYFQFPKNDGQGIFWEKHLWSGNIISYKFCFNLKKDHDCAFILRSILIHVN